MQAAGERVRACPALLRATIDAAVAVAARAVTGTAQQTTLANPTMLARTQVGPRGNSPTEQGTCLDEEAHTLSSHRGVG